MPSPTYTVFRNAILREQQVICTYKGRHRELCPHIIGTNKRSQEAVLAWQFSGDVSSGTSAWRQMEMPNTRQCQNRPRTRWPLV
jgi:hypothetical protein